MAVRSGFYNSIAHDRKYNATDMSKLFSGIINDGVFMTVGTKFKTLSASGMAVSVGTGRAWFDSTWTDNDSPLLLSISASDVTLNRIDAVVLEVNRTDEVRANSIKIVKGTPASTPTKPTLVKSTSIKQWALAYILIPAGSTAVLQSNITYVVGMEETPFVTGLIQTNSLDGLYLQWEAVFNKWFTNLQNQLDTNQASNLQNQINNNADNIDKLALDAYRIGDTLVTGRSQLDDRWVLSNGAPVSAEEYPALSSMLKPNILSTWEAVPSWQGGTYGEAECVDHRGWLYRLAMGSSPRYIEMTKDGVVFTKIVDLSSNISNLCGIVVDKHNRICIYHYSGSYSSQCYLYVDYISWDGTSIDGVWTNNMVVWTHETEKRLFTRVNYDSDVDVLYFLGYITRYDQSENFGLFKKTGAVLDSPSLTLIKQLPGIQSSKPIAQQFVVKNGSVGVVSTMSGDAAVLVVNNGVVWDYAPITQWIVRVFYLENRSMFGVFLNHSSGATLKIGTRGTSVVQYELLWYLLSRAFTCDGELYSILDSVSSTSPAEARVKKLYKLLINDSGESGLSIVYQFVEDFTDPLFIKDNTEGINVRFFDGKNFKKWGINTFLPKRLPMLSSDLYTFIKVREE